MPTAIGVQRFPSAQKTNITGCLVNRAGEETHAFISPRKRPEVGLGSRKASKLTSTARVEVAEGQSSGESGKLVLRKKTTFGNSASGQAERAQTAKKKKFLVGKGGN